MCSADSPEAADGPDVEDATDCGRAVDKPAVGSAFEGGHRLRAGFFLVNPSTGAPFVCTDDAEMVEFEDADEAIEEDEVVRCAAFRGMNIRETSSALMEFMPFGAPLGALHPAREMGWKFGGGATAVICHDSKEQLPRRGSCSCVVRFLQPSSPYTECAVATTLNPTNPSEQQLASFLFVVSYEYHGADLEHGAAD